MDLFQIQLSPTAAQTYRTTPLFDRQAIADLLEDLRIGQFPEADYEEPHSERDQVTVVLAGSMAIAYVTDLTKKVVKVVWIRPADSA